MGNPGHITVREKILWQDTELVAQFDLRHYYALRESFTININIPQLTAAALACNTGIHNIGGFQ